MRDDFIESFPKKKLQEIWESTEVEPGVLYIVGTPIGNLGDISVRALSTLAQVDTVLAEDTRTSSELLLPFGIKPHYLSFHQHNFRSRIENVIADLESGKSIAQISDAGMPTISDPGVELVDACLDAGLEVRVVPGPSASIAKLVWVGCQQMILDLLVFCHRKNLINMNSYKILRIIGVLQFFMKHHIDYYKL